MRASTSLLALFSLLEGASAVTFADAEASFRTLQQWYNVSNGLYVPSTGWWNSANGESRKMPDD